MKQLIFLGSNYNLTQMTDICDLLEIPIAGLIDSDYFGNRKNVCDVPVIGSEDLFTFSDDYVYFNAVNVGVGSAEYVNRNRAKHQKFSELITHNNLKCVNLIHPTAIVPKTASLGKNILVGSYAVLGNHTVVEDYCQIREQSYLAHHAILRQGTIMQVQSYVGANIEMSVGSYVAVKSVVLSRGSGGVVPAGTFVKSAERMVI